MNIAAIMPCRGRAEQTVRNVRRLLATAGNGGAWRLYCVGAIPDVQPLKGHVDPTFVTILTVARESALTYWEALQATMFDTDASLIANLANDLWACDDWLKLAVEEYQRRFADRPGLLGFAGDGHTYSHSCHFVISRALLDRYGGWPVWYTHNFGDAELCARARADGLYAKSFAAYLEHCHPERGLAEDDAVYAEGRVTYKQDEALFVERRRLGWPLVSP